MQVEHGLPGVGVAVEDRAIARFRYPVAGSQINWGTFLWVPLLVLAVHDAWRWLQPSVARAGRYLVPAGALGAFALAYYMGGRLLTSAWNNRHQGEPLNLAGGCFVTPALVRAKPGMPEKPFAAESTLASDASIASLRGRVHRYAGVPLIVTYHPAYLLRTLPDKAKAWSDLVFARHLMQDLQAGRAAPN